MPASAVLPLLLLLAQPRAARLDAPAADAPKAVETKKEDKKEEKEEPPVVTRHELRAGGRVLKYTATAGLMPLRSETGELEAHVFYVAYTLDRGGAPLEKRPLMFSFNGGPGSSSVWLHMGALGPKRVKMKDDGMMPPPPYALVDNEDTWLTETDLVFIDPVGTGYSRAVKPELGKKFWGVDGDIASVGEFIRLYLARNERWASPLFLVGESYGTTRAAGLSGYLVEKGIAFNGILLVSSILNFQTGRFTKGNDLPYPLFLPTYTATAWYHKKLSPDLQQDFAKTRAEVEQWTSTGYAEALAKGDRLSPEERSAVIDRLSRYTGLSKTFIDQANLRIDEPHFTKELLRDQKLVVGRLDSRFTGIDLSEKPLKVAQLHQWPHENSCGGLPGNDFFAVEVMALKLFRRGITILY